VALILLAAAIVLAPAAMARFGFRGFVALYIVAVLLWLPLRRFALPLGPTLVIGLALRTMFLVPEPALSGDVYRYLADGRRLASGHNPYTYTPDDPRINHPEIRSIYPPLAQLLFAQFEQPYLGLFGRANAGAALLVWKLILIAADLAAIVLLRKYGAAFAFATCPLVLFEGVWNGHIDALAAVFLGLALARRSGFFAGVAAGLKIIPLAAVPALFGRRRPPFSFLFAFFAPFLVFLGGPIMPGFRDYATRWIFNSPLYDLVRAIVERIPTKEIWTHHPLRFEAISDVVYRYLYPDFLTRAILATLAVAGILLARRVTTAVGVLLLCSPAIHPWYWLTLVPVAFMEQADDGPPASRRLEQRRPGAEGGSGNASEAAERAETAHSQPARTPAVHRIFLALALCAPLSYLLYVSASPLLVHALCYGIPLVTLWRD
jgi:glycosyl transferase family 87